MGLLPPFYDQGRLLIDGGYVDNVPVQVMRALASSAAQIVVSDVENKDNTLFEGVDNYGDSLSGWWVAWKWLLSLVYLSKPLRIPPLSEVALKVSYISHTMLMRELVSAADDSILYVRPDILRFKLLDYHLLPEIVEAGAAAARLVIDRSESRARLRMQRAARKAQGRSIRSLSLNCSLSARGLRARESSQSHVVSTELQSLSTSSEGEDQHQREYSLSLNGGEVKPRGLIEVATSGESDTMRGDSAVISMAVTLSDPSTDSKHAGSNAPSSSISASSSAASGDSHVLATTSRAGARAGVQTPSSPAVFKGNSRALGVSSPLVPLIRGAQASASRERDAIEGVELSPAVTSARAALGAAMGRPPSSSSNSASGMFTIGGTEMS
jgi:hypothetical protein